MNSHMYTFKIITNNESLYKGQVEEDQRNNLFKFYQICTYPAKTSSQIKILEGRVIYFKQDGSYSTKKINIPKRDLDEFISKIPTSSYRLYPMYNIDKVEITNELFHYASSGLLS